MIMNGKIPTLISGVPKRALSLATIRSQASASAERAGQHVAVGGAERRLAELADRAEQAREAVGREVLVDERGLRGEAAEVAARGEHLLVRRGEHDAAHGVVVARARERGQQLVEQRVGQGVARLGAVERDGGDCSATS